MENASKALIIAGAILISILLISVGVIIMNQTSKVTDGVGGSVDTMAIETFNSQFLNYEGEKKNAQQVKALVSKVNASNATNEVTSDTQEKYVSIDWKDGLDPSTLKTTQKYTVKMDYAGTGYINKVTISKST